jgi:hypothetical protein
LAWISRDQIELQEQPREQAEEVNKRRIKAVLIDLGDTLVDEGILSRDPSGQVVSGAAMTEAMEIIEQLRGARIEGGARVEQ